MSDARFNSCQCGVYGILPSVVQNYYKSPQRLYQGGMEAIGNIDFTLLEILDTEPRGPCIGLAPMKVFAAAELLAFHNNVEENSAPGGRSAD